MSTLSDDTAQDTTDHPAYARGSTSEHLDQVAGDVVPLDSARGQNPDKYQEQSAASQTRAVLRKALGIDTTPAPIGNK